MDDLVACDRLRAAAQAVVEWWDDVALTDAAIQLSDIGETGVEQLIDALRAELPSVPRRGDDSH